jgi:hypothetical protein
MPRQERAERYRHAEDRGRPDGNAQRDDEHRQCEQLTRTGPGDLIEQARDDAAANRQREHREARHFEDREADGQRQSRGGAEALPPRRRWRIARGEDGRQHHEDEDGEQILHDEPADGDVSGRCMELAVVREDADQDDSAGDGERDPEDDRARPLPAKQAGDAGAQHRSDGALRDRAWDRDSAHGEQLLEMELQADPEHQQDDADFGELFGEMCVRREAGRMRTDRDPCQQVADDGREAETLGDVARDEGGS